MDSDGCVLLCRDWVTPAVVALLLHTFSTRWPFDIIVAALGTHTRAAASRFVARQVARWRSAVGALAVRTFDVRRYKPTRPWRELRGCATWVRARYSPTPDRVRINVVPIERADSTGAETSVRDSLACHACHTLTHTHTHTHTTV